MAEKTSFDLGLNLGWLSHSRISYRSAVDAMRQLSVSLLTVSHISHSISQSGVHKACSQLLTSSFLSSGLYLDCCFTLFRNETSKLGNLYIVCCSELMNSCSSLL